MNDTERYLTRVAALLPDKYVSIHHKQMFQDGRASLPGDACQKVNELARQASYWSHDRSIDVWLAMGAQEQCGQPRDRPRYPKALRTTMNTIAAKCFYVDVDVDGNPEKDCYRTREEMDVGIDAFLLGSGLPLPNIVVNSGSGGKHLYWVLFQLIDPEDFKRVSRGLADAAIALGFKCDTVCTVDICRLLRVPGTFNYKTGKPLPVTIDSWLDQDYELDNIALPLAGYIGKTGIKSTPDGGELKDADPEDVDDLGGGVDNRYALADIDEVAKECPFIRDTLVNGGAGYIEPLWKQTISIACHTIDPEGTAIRLSNGHKDYDEQVTLDKLAVAQRDRQQRSSLGPPKCATIHTAGSKACASCQHLQRNTTPISFGRVPPAGPPSPPSPNGGPAPSNSDLPDGYFRGPDKYIYLSQDGKSVLALKHQIVPHSGYFEANMPWHFVCNTMQSGNEQTIRFPYSDAMDKLSFARIMASHGMNINFPEAHKFMVNWVTFLRSQDRLVINIPPLGWHQRNGVTGFAYDNRFVSSFEEAKAQRLPHDQGKYGAFGNDQPWRDLAGIVLTPDRPDLAVMVASGFASPLLHFTGHNGVIVGGWSAQSGIAKTTSMSLAQAVWGCPSGMSGLDDTINFVMAKASTLKCLPLFYDEIKTPEQVKNLSNLIHNLTRGVEKGRLNTKGEMKPTREWETQITFAANTSMAKAVEELQKGTLAGLYRLFEFECMMNKPTIHSSGSVARMTKQLHTNYGVIGRAYAEYLGRYHDDVSKFVVAEHEKYHAHLNGTQEERYWTAVIGTHMAGAQFANLLGVANFPIDEMEAFLLQEFDRMRGDQTKSMADYNNTATIIAELANVLNHYRARNTVVTDTMLLTAGKPPKNSVHVLNDKMLDNKKEAIHVHIALQPLALRISTLGLNQWCKANNIPSGNFTSGMQSHLGAKLSGARLASGTEYATGTMMLWTIPLQGTALEKEVEWAYQYQ
jgi:hypothetical protein